MTKSAAKPRVLILTDYFYPHWTGICKSLYYLLKHLGAEYAFTILTVQFRPDLPKQERVQGATVLREKPQMTISRAHYSVGTMFKLAKIISHVDTILINSPYTNILPAAIITKLFGKQLVILHQADFILPKGLINRLIEGVYFFCSFIGFSLADRVTSWNDDYGQYSPILKLFRSKFSALTLPLALPKPAPNDRIRKKLARMKRDGYLLFGFAGRFVEEKGFDILFAAIPAIVKKIPNARFVYAGQLKISYERFFEKHAVAYERVQPYIESLGFVSDTELVSFYQSIDYIVVPSRSDAFPLVQAEAASSGAIPITANIPGARTLIQDTQYGLLFQKENPEDLANKVIEAIRKRSKLRTHYPDVLAYFDIQKTRSQFSRLITGQLR